MPRWCAAAVCQVALITIGAGTAAGQNYPNKPVRIVTAEPGGGNDFAARMIMPGLAAGLGQPVIIENRGGASGAIAADTVAKAPPDGYSLLLYASGIWLIPFLRANVPYDPVRDLAPITLVAKSPNLVVVHPSLPVKSVKDLIALAKAKPGQLNYGTSPAGSSTHLAVELLKSMTGAKIVGVTYKATGPAINALIAGEVQLVFPSAAAVSPHIKSGKLRALAVTSAEPSALAPGLPTVAATVPGYEALQMYGVFAPAKSPDTVIRRLNQEIVRVLNQPEIKQKFLLSGTETIGNSPEEFAATIKSDMARMGKVIKDAGIREE